MLIAKVANFCLLAMAVSTPTVSAGFWSASDQEGALDQGDVVPDGTPKTPDEPVEYGVDVSFPMHYVSVSTNYPSLEHNKNPSVPTPNEYEDMVLQPLGNRQEFYKEYLDSCRESFGARGSTRCTHSEIDRIAMTLRQPQSMQNYTENGFQKIKAPEKVFSLIKAFWEKNKDKGKTENWGVGNTYTNNWKIPSTMISVEDTTLRGGGRQLKQQIWDAAKDVIEEWSGEEVTECSLYGIRVYHEGSVLAPHVDRLPLVTSAIINVAQNSDEPWPLEVIAHDGRAHNITMEVGDMVLYESHSVIHGRPFPLKGKDSFFANIFIHFEPTGHSLRHDAKMADAKQDVHTKYKEAVKRGFSGHESDNNSGLPSYIKPGTPEETHWRAGHPQGQKQRSKTTSFTTGSTEAHAAAQAGDVRALKRELDLKKDAVHAKDSNGWTPLHEGARGGHLEVVKYLVEQGADFNQKTDGAGGTALYWAKKELGVNHPVVSFLEELGALEIGPDL